MADNDAATMVQEIFEKLKSHEARLAQLESFHGFIHAEAGAAAEAAFQEFPKAVGDAVAYSAEEERALLATAKKVGTALTPGV